MKLPFIEIIASVTPDPNLLMWKFPDADQEIKNGAALIVRESQSAILLSEGQVADTFTAGKHSLKTENIPILTRLKGWEYGFESPFKADVYFFNTHQFVNLKWGTPAPVLMRDPGFGQVRIRSFGTYNIRIADVVKFFKEYAGTYPRLTIAELELQLRDFISPRFAEVLAKASISVLDVAGNISELNQKIQPVIQSYFTVLGLEATQFTITSVTLPEEVLKHYDQVTGMNMVTDINKYAQFSVASAMDKENSAMGEAARNTVAMGMMMNQAAPVVPQPAEDIPSRFKKLKDLFEAQLITEAEYSAKKEELLNLL